jgi:hypothetical protein
MVCNPRINLAYCRAQKWGTVIDDEVLPAIKTAFEMYETKDKTNNQCTNDNEVPSNTDNVVQSISFEPSWMQEELCTQDNENRELVEYTSLPKTGYEVHLFWSNNKTNFPTMYKIAMDYLPIPATSANVERLFSKAGALLNKRRARMKDGTLRAIMCGRNWLQVLDSRKKVLILKTPSVLTQRSMSSVQTRKRCTNSFGKKNESNMLPKKRVPTEQLSTYTVEQVPKAPSVVLNSADNSDGSSYNGKEMRDFIAQLDDLDKPVPWMIDFELENYLEPIITKRYGFLSSTLVHVLLANANDKQKHHAKNICTTLLSNQVTIMAICKDNHFVAVVFYRHKKDGLNVRVLNSMNTKTLYINQLMDILRSTSMLGEVQIINQTLQVQPDTNTCGYRVLHIIKQICTNSKHYWQLTKSELMDLSNTFDVLETRVDFSNSMYK